MAVNGRLFELREEMRSKNLDAYIITTSDPHNSEYIADRYKSREWISGFTGSAGTVVITRDEANLWTDGRYFIQAEKEIEGTEFKLYKEGIEGYPTYQEWLRDRLDRGDRVGVSGEVFSQGEYENLEKIVAAKKIEIVDDYDLVDNIWDNRPEIPNTDAFQHEEKWAGKSIEEKLRDVRTLMRSREVQYFLVTSLDDVSWLYNIRARDVKYSPVITAYALISLEDAYMFVNHTRITKDIMDVLEKNGVKVLDYHKIADVIKSLDDKKRIYLDKNNVNRLIYSSIPSNMEKVNGVNLTSIIKAKKSHIEIENQKNAYIKDGVALTKFLYWLDTNIGKQEITELDAAAKILELRQEQEGFIEPSFETISAYGENAAMMHYSATEEVFSILEPKGLYLIDSGGQYYDGTTDITRTVVLGEITDEEKRDFTLTLKGHINLINGRFLYGSTGHQLDAIARYPLWQEGLDYKCGTGHGVGYLLNVHEGPHRISRAQNSIILEEGMITSIEPGVYKSGSHGIRIENIAVVSRDIRTDSGQFMRFEVLSYAPIDLRGIESSMLSESEKEWLNNYHSKVFNKLKAFLESDEREWLKEKTKKII